MKPFTAVVRYKSKIDDDVIEVEYELDDPAELHTVIMQGPNWGALIYASITRSEDLMFGPVSDYEDLPNFEHTNTWLRMDAPCDKPKDEAI